MIPPDLASRLSSAAGRPGPVAPVQDIADRLSGFSVGQRLMAEVQALLPNGTCRALVDQRNILLALPFPARSGDMLELEVVESDGRIALAVLSHRGGETGREDAATISRAGQLIGYLLSKAHSEGHEAMPLNARQALADAPLTRAQDILPRLKEAIVRSGMFYESHQAEWVEGRLARTELLREPQGRLSAYPESPAERALPPSSSLPAESAPLAQTAGSVVATQIQNIVHQQLEALANQTFVWQGLLWPGQEMRLEIEEDGRNHQDEEGNAEQGWHTRLKLSFPRLGAINAKLRLHDRQVSLTLCLDQERSLDIMRAETETLRQSLKEAGLILASLAFYHEPAQTS